MLIWIILILSLVAATIIVNKAQQFYMKAMGTSAMFYRGRTKLIAIAIVGFLITAVIMYIFNIEVPGRAGASQPPITQQSVSAPTPTLTIQQNTNSLDMSLVGLWILEEEPWIMREFFADGTGFFEGQGPSFEFIWWVEDGSMLYVRNSIDGWVSELAYEIIDGRLYIAWSYGGNSGIDVWVR